MILAGLGFTTQRLAKRLLLHNGPVYGLARRPERYRLLESLGLRMDAFPRSATVVYSVPPLESPDRERLRDVIRALEPRRVVYISATTVYGEQTDVDETTLPQPSGPRSVARLEEERWFEAGAWRTLIVRPAAIYGPGRGVHEKIRERQLPRGAGIVSRIHVEDLAAVLEAAVFSDLEGAWPLADEHPCSSEEIAAYAARLTGIDLTGMNWPRFDVAGRRASGRAILGRLGVRLLYPTYESGILASLITPAQSSADPIR